MSNFEIRCIQCHRMAVFPERLCRRCGGLIDTIYPEDAAIRPGFDGNLRYTELLPVNQRALLERVPIQKTKLVADSSKVYGSVDIEVFFKDETSQPTGTTKDRMASVALPFLYEQGVREFVLSSTGNTASSFLYALSYFGDMRCHAFMGSQFLWEYRKTASMDTAERLVVHEVDGDYVYAQNEARDFARRFHLLDEQGFFNIGRHEGAKTAYLEAIEQMPKEPDIIVQAVSSGIGSWAALRAIEAGERLGLVTRRPRLVCAQQDTCAPMVTAARVGSTTIRPIDVVPNPEGVAKAILLGNPASSYPWVKNVVDSTGGCFISVTKAQILSALERVSRELEIPLCESSAVAVAAAEELCRRRQIVSGDVVLVMIGGGR